MSPRTIRSVARPLVAALVTLGALVPLAMKVHGALLLDVHYHAWTWPAIPAVWLPAIAGAWLAGRSGAAGALLLCVGAAAGVAIFWRELGVLTFGPAWLLGAWLYLDAGRSGGLLRRRSRGGAAPVRVRTE